MLADVGYVSFCDVSATVSCTQVYSSRFGVFAGIPVAVFGAIWFALATLLAIAGFVARAEVRESIPGYLFAGSTLALAAVQLQQGEGASAYDMAQASLAKSDDDPWRLFLYGDHVKLQSRIADLRRRIQR